MFTIGLNHKFDIMIERTRKYEVIERKKKKEQKIRNENGLVLKAYKKSLMTTTLILNHVYYNEFIEEYL